VADFRLWPSTDGPSTASLDSGGPSLATEFYVTATAWLTQLWFWRPTTEVTGPVVGRVYRVDTETAVAGTDVTFTLSATGWHAAALAAAVALEPNVRYRATVRFPNNYASTGSYWSTGPGGPGITNGPLTAPGSGGGATQSSFQGAFVYAPGLAFPASQFSATNYWVDLTVSDTDPDAHVGAGTATIALAAEASGTKSTTGAGSADLTLAAAGTGTKDTSAAGAAPLTLAAEATATRGATGSGTAPLGLGGGGIGEHHGSASGTAALGLAAHGTAGPGSGEQIDPKTSGRFGGDVPALGGPGNVPPPAMWPRTVSFLMYPAGTFFRARTKLLRLDGGLSPDSASLARGERPVLFVEEASKVCKRSYDSLHVTVPICPSGETGGAAISQPGCETLPAPGPAPTLSAVEVPGDPDRMTVALRVDNHGHGPVTVQWGQTPALPNGANTGDNATPTTVIYTQPGTWSIVVTDNDEPTRTATIMVAVPFTT
jgi:hypothetical protein